MNITYIRTQLETQFKVAKKVLHENPSKEAQEVYDKLKSNLDKLNEIKRNKARENKTINAAEIFNDRTRKLQIEEDRKRSELIKKKSKNSSHFDPFSTLACRPQILWNTQKSTDQQNNPEGKTDDKEQANKSVKKEETIKKPKHEYKTDFEKSLARKERILHVMKTIEIPLNHLISVDPNDFSKYPKFSKMPRLVDVHPVLKAKLEEKQRRDLSADTRKVYSLDEYYDKYMS